MTESLLRDPPGFGDDVCTVGEVPRRDDLELGLLKLSLLGLSGRVLEELVPGLGERILLDSVDLGEALGLL